MKLFFHSVLVWSKICPQHSSYIQKSHSIRVKLIIESLTSLSKNLWGIFVATLVRKTRSVRFGSKHINEKRMRTKRVLNCFENCFDCMLWLHVSTSEGYKPNIKRFKNWIDNNAKVDTNKTHRIRFQRLVSRLVRRFKHMTYDS